MDASPETPPATPAPQPPRLSPGQFRSLVVIIVLTFVASLGSTVSYTSYVDRERKQGEAKAAADRAEQAEQTRLLVCELSLRNAEVYADATTPVGQEARDVWLRFAEKFHCKPPK